MRIIKTKFLTSRLLNTACLVLATSLMLIASLPTQASTSVVAWGDNYFGQTNVPAGLSNVLAVSTGTFHCLALKDDGTIVGWGDNSYGQRNIPAGLRACLNSGRILL